MTINLYGLCGARQEKFGEDESINSDSKNNKRHGVWHILRQ